MSGATHRCRGTACRAPTEKTCSRLANYFVAAIAYENMLDTEIKVTPELAAEHGLTAEEYSRIQKILGRDPSFTELGIFSVMWSEHCSYKSSKAHLRRLPT